MIFVPSAVETQHWVVIEDLTNILNCLPYVIGSDGDSASDVWHVYGN